MMFSPPPPKSVGDQWMAVEEDDLKREVVEFARNYIGTLSWVGSGVWYVVACFASYVAEDNSSAIMAILFATFHLLAGWILRQQVTQ